MSLNRVVSFEPPQDERAQALNQQTTTKPTLLPSPIPDEAGAAELLENYLSPRMEEEFPSFEETVSDNSSPFHAYFTIIEDSSTGEHSHPHVHYIFSDDEQDRISNALLHTLDPHTQSESDLGKDAAMNENMDPDERIIVIDMAADGQTVLSAKSLCPDWQVSDTWVTTAPTFQESIASSEAGLMLRIMGREKSIPHGETAPKARLQQALDSQQGGDMMAAMRSLADQFYSELEELERTTGNYMAPQSR